MKVVKDQYGVPTSTELIGKVTLDAIQSIEKKKSWNSGIYNLVPNGETNWYEMTLLIQKIGQKLENEKKLMDVYIEGVNSIETKLLAKRPKNSLLLNDKLQKVISFQLPYWQQDFIKTTNEILKKDNNDY